MELVKLKMRSIYKVPLTILGLLICFVSLIGILYATYDKFINNSAIEVDGDLSINFIDGKDIDINKEKKYDLSVTNSGEDTCIFTISVINIKGHGTYKLYYADEIIKDGNINPSDELVIDELSIGGKVTNKYVLEIDAKDELTGILDFKFKEKEANSFKDIILKNNKVNNTYVTKPGIEIAIDNEGLIKSNDDDGVTYYFRGNIDNNYVLFDSKSWRIVRINGDDTIRIVLEDAVLGRYYDEKEKNYEYSSSSMNTFLNSWLEENISNKDYLADSKFCSDISHNDSNEYNAYTRIMTNNIPTFNCLGEIYTGNIGILSIDEVMFAGINTKDKNEKYYLYNSSFTNPWYTMTGMSGNDSSMNLFMINTNGTINKDINGNLYRNVRPVVNLKSLVEVTGDGTKDNPYVIG